MKHIRIIFALATCICLSACLPKERPVTPSDGTTAVTIHSPQMVVEGKHIYIYYFRDGETVRSEILEDGSLSDPVYADEKHCPDLTVVEPTYQPEVDEDTKAVMAKMLYESEPVSTPDGERLFFTAYSRETGKRELYWIRNGGILPVRVSQDDWWADFSVPFGFLEMKDQAFYDGSKAYVVLCLVNDHWNAGEIGCVYMDGRQQYTILSHENSKMRDRLSHSVAVGKTDMTTKAGSVIHYMDYRDWSYTLDDQQTGRPDKRPIHIIYADEIHSSCVAWNEKAIKNALAGEQVIVVSENDYMSPQDCKEFEDYIHTNYK